MDRPGKTVVKVCPQVAEFALEKHLKHETFQQVAKGREQERLTLLGYKMMARDTVDECIRYKRSVKQTKRPTGVASPCTLRTHTAEIMIVEYLYRGFPAVLQYALQRLRREKPF